MANFTFGLRFYLPTMNQPNLLNSLKLRAARNQRAIIPIQRASEQVFHRILGKHRAQKLYDSWQGTDVYTFLNTYKAHSHVKHKISAQQFDKIPAEKSLLVLSNHPTGIADGLLILDALLKRRTDVKLIIDIDTYRVEALDLYTIGVHSEHEKEFAAQNEMALNSALQWLKDGHCLVLFSHSEVMLNKRIYKSDKDSFWDPIAREIIKKHDGFIVPWAIRGKNSPLFYQLSRIHPKLKHNLIPRESLRRRFRPIESAIGKPFKVSDAHSLLDLELKIRLMSKRPALLDLPNVLPQFKNSRLKTIAPATENSILGEEIAQLGAPLVVKAHNEVYLSPPGKSPQLLNEIGRLREITFRQVGEGSGKDRDLDEYDRDFYHLILWDSEAQCIAGAYRLGMGPDLHQRHGYRSILYDFYHKNEHTEHLLKNAMLMGRAFVIPSYQQKPFPLFLLWNGIMEVLKMRPDISYLIGQTSLPNTYHNYSKLLITEFLWKHFSDAENRKFFVPFHALRMRRNPLISRWVSLSKSEDIKRMDKIIECIEPDGAKTPMLFKRYIDQNAQCIGINVDPEFQNSIDILMLTKVNEIVIGR